MSVEEQLNIMKSWWTEIDPLNTRLIHKRQFSAFMISKGIVKKEQEMERLLKKMINETANINGMISHTQYIKCFTKAILKTAIFSCFNEHKDQELAFIKMKTSFKFE